jgi:PAS domain S-box-containing protein
MNWRSQSTEFAADAADTRALLDTMIESLPGIAYFYDGSGKFLRWNRNFETVSGYSGEEIARMHPLDFFAAEDKPLLEGRIAEVFARGESSVEALFLRKDGTSVPYFFTGRRVAFEGQACLVGVGIDVADRREAEKRLAQSELKYRELVEYANSIILRWNSEGRITFLNEFGQRFFGYSSEEAVGRHVLETIVPQTESSGRDLTKLMEDICAAPESFEQNVNENVRRNGERVWIAWTNRIVRDAQGRVVELLSVGSDITASRRAEQKVREMEEQVRQAQKMEAIGLLAGGVAHDFNNILAAILGNAELALADTAEGHPARESLAEIKKASLRATSLVQQILAFSRHQPHERQVVDLGATLREAAGFLRATIPSIVELDFFVDPATPAVLADATQVYQVIANLCTNAWHALEGRAGHINVRLEPIELDAETAERVGRVQAGRFACLSVTDDGKGMDADTLARIFEPFFTTKAPGKGTGLGLSVVHGIMQSHAGAIEVKSQPGRGTAFRLYFPASSTVAPFAQKAAATTREARGERVLYVDDEEPLIFLAKRMLERLGYHITGCTRAQDAIDVFSKSPSQFDVVVTDMNMPGCSGLELATALLRERPDIPIVLCSGHVTDELREAARRIGVREVVYKPSTMEEFGEAIHRLAARAAPHA